MISLIFVTIKSPFKYTGYLQSIYPSTVTMTNEKFNAVINSACSGARRRLRVVGEQPLSTVLGLEQENV